MCVAFMTEKNRQSSPNTNLLLIHIYLDHKLFWVTTDNLSTGFYNLTIWSQLPVYQN